MNILEQKNRTFIHNKNTRYCLNCNSDKTYKNKWYKYKIGFICKNCYSKLIDNPKKNPKRMWFKNNHITLKKYPRINICQKCGKIGITQIHHINYHDNNVLKDTIELCLKCHSETKERNSKGQFIK